MTARLRNILAFAGNSPYLLPRIGERVNSPPQFRQRED